MGIKSQNGDQYSIADSKLTPQAAAFGIGIGITSSTCVTRRMRTNCGNPKALAGSRMPLKQATHPKQGARHFVLDWSTLPLNVRPGP